MHGGVGHFMEAGETGQGSRRLGEHGLKASLQRDDERALNFQAEITPSLRNAVAVVFLPHIEPADNRPFAIHYQ